MSTDGFLARYPDWEKQQTDRGVDVEWVKAHLRNWPSRRRRGATAIRTRFEVFQQEGVPRSPFEKIEERGHGAQSDRRGTVGRPAHPWDLVDDFSALKNAEDHGIKLGAINPNLFQEDDYKLEACATPIRRCARRPCATCSTASPSRRK